MVEPVVDDFMYSQTPFPACCGAAILHNFGLRRDRKDKLINWDVLPEDFIKGLTKKFDAAISYAAWSAALVAVTIPACPGRSKHYAHFDKVEEILLATGWTPGLKSRAPHGPYFNQFWTRPSKGIYIKE